MKLRLLIRIIIIASVVLLCTGIALYSFLSIRSVENRHDFNLYTLVPQDATAVFETDCMAELVADINSLNCSKDNHYLYVSELFAGLKKHLFTLADDMPHGLSKQMNKVLVSFHEPDNPMNQVLYCTLGAGDVELVEAFVRKQGFGASEPIREAYKDEEIRIYPLKNGNSLVAYVTTEFLAVSFQKQLIEQVIDTRRSKKSLMELPEFRAMHEGRHHHVPATVYVHIKGVDMGKPTDTLRIQLPLGGWAEFDMKFREDAVYCSGISHADSTHTFFHALRVQQPVRGFSGDQLPASTFFCTRWAMSDVEALTGFLPGFGEEWMAYLKEFAGESAATCLFLPKDTLQRQPCAVMSVPVKDEQAARQHLPSPADKSAVRFHRGNLLLAHDAATLSEYVDAIERENVLEGNPAYARSIGSLSPTYNFLMMADMERLLNQPESYVRLMPAFFIRHAKFFRHFLLAVQLTCTEGVVYPNIVLIYK